LASIPEDAERGLVATGRYLGEGFDDALLDTLFLTMPISWRGTLAQYAGRLHRLHASKRDVIIYDYVDENEAMLAKMAARRKAGYRNLGYRSAHSAELNLRHRGDTQRSREA
jgi:superfamily II DNA or RNA helicase